METGKRYTLHQLNTLVKNAIEGNMDFAYWVEAEISSLSVKAGHCYIDLIEKDPRSNTPTAHSRAQCWANQWAYVSGHFLSSTGSQLAAGMKILVQVRPTFHAAYGFSWNIIDIDPTYTIGDMQRKREEIIRTLKEDGVFDMQRQLPFSAFTKRIAVISAKNAAGYGDFCSQLAGNTYGFRFHTELFEAVMQGENVEKSIIAALNAIYERIDEFDCVVIIRGGGATSDLSGFDTLPLAQHVAQFPLPIITGIGHERDNCVIDLISFARVKTPTAAAVMLIDNLAATFDIIDSVRARVERFAKNAISTERLKLQSVTEKLPYLAHLAINQQRNTLQLISTKINGLSSLAIQNEKNRLLLLTEKVRNLNPELLLQRGYSMTFANGKIVTSTAQLRPGDTITTKLKDGKITSIVK
ncbi:MAG: exodeoxyribonuclease VII large subunit [Bacteroidaceae bacterium]|nr:exodeoxyribonuclease VII large subunit [Bacteroidaceae bacterium]